MSTITAAAANLTTHASSTLADERWDGPGAWWPVFPLLWFLLIAGLVITFALSRRRQHRLAGPRAGKARLAERYATGDIGEQEYRERLAVLESTER